MKHWKHHFPRQAIVYSSLLFMACGAWRELCADEFQLKDGRAITGRAVQQGDANPQWAVELTQGSYVRFADAEVAHSGHRTIKPELLKEYQAELAKLQPTAESHIRIAGWCRSKGLTSQADAHYYRALDFDPDDARARSALKFSKNESGRWVKLDELMTEGRGKVKDGAKYVYPEVLAIETARREADEKSGQWKSKLMRWHRDIATGKSNAEKSLFELGQVNDPIAIATIRELLLKGKPAATRVLKLTYVTLLTQFQSLDAVTTLADASVLDEDAAVREACFDALSRFGRDAAIGRYIGHLKNTNPLIVNRAGAGLQAMKADKAVFPLIEAVVTLHKQVVQPKGDSYNNTGAMTFGGDKAEVKLVPSNNEWVLGALVELTGKNFQYDKAAWINWYASLYAAPVTDLRRDP